MTGDRRTVLRIALFFGLVVAAQALSVPRGAGPDEPAHVRRGAALVRGELLGDEPDGDPSGAVRTFELPGWVGAPDPGCYAQHPDVPASCATVPADSDATQTLESTAATNPPWSHLLPGLGTLAPGQARTLWLSRLLHAIVPVGLVVAALARLRAAGREGELGVALLALTPMALFTFSVVNPSGWSVAGAFVVWVAARDVARGDPTAGTLLAVGWTVAVVARNDGPLWMLAALAIVLLVERCSVRRFWARMPMVARLAMPSALAVNIAWTLLVPPKLVETNGLNDAGFGTVANSIISRTGEHLRSAVGVLGWLDASIPETALLLWWVAVGVLLGVALMVGNTRAAFGAAAALIGFVAISWVIEFSRVRDVGLYWQGRYALPLLLGVPLLLAPRNQDRSASIGRTVGVIAVIVWNVTYLQALRRWGVGEDGSLGLWSWGTYSTPLPIEVLILVHVTASVGLLNECLGRPRSRPTAAPALADT